MWFPVSFWTDLGFLTANIHPLILIQPISICDHWPYICSSELSPDLSWSPHNDLCENDHFSIFITSNNHKPHQQEFPSEWLINKPIFSHNKQLKKQFPNPQPSQLHIRYFDGQQASKGSSKIDKRPYVNIDHPINKSILSNKRS